MQNPFIIKEPKMFGDYIRFLLAEYPDRKLILLDAPMGAGKTAFVKEFCKVLNYLGEASSPSFSIVNEYKCAGANVFHFDLYRIEKQEELFEFGFEDYLSQNNYCLIEWPKMAEGFIEQIPRLRIKLSILPDGTRELLYTIED